MITLKHCSGLTDKEYARRLHKKHFREMMSEPDSKLRWKNSYQKSTNPVNPKNSKDPLYQRLAKVEDLARYYSNQEDPFIMDICNNIRTDMEHRIIDSSTYCELSSFSSPRDLHQELIRRVKDGQKYWQVGQREFTITSIRKTYD
jgi:hypothetical protein